MERTSPPISLAIISLATCNELVCVPFRNISLSRCMVVFCRRSVGHDPKLYNGGCMWNWPTPFESGQNDHQIDS